MREVRTTSVAVPEIEFKDAVQSIETQMKDLKMYTEKSYKAGVYPLHITGTFYGNASAFKKIDFKGITNLFVSIYRNDINLVIRHYPPKGRVASLFLEVPIN